MTLQDKNAIIYGAGGSIGGQLARTFATAGARVFLTGRSLEPLEKVAAEIRASGGRAEVDLVDALNEKAVDDHIVKVSRQAGSIDISFNVIGLEVVQNIPLTEMSMDDFTRPVNIAMRGHFLTARAAGKVMARQGSGVILSLTATPGGIGYPFTAGFAPACSAIESLSRNLASELGIYGVRVVNIRSAGSPDSKVFKEAIDNHPDIMATVIKLMEQDTMLKKLPMMADIANLALFLASDMAGKITGVTVDATCGTTAGLNYRSSLEKAVLLE